MQHRTECAGDVEHICSIAFVGKTESCRAESGWGRLAAMNWRRGMLLAGVNVLVALPLICLLASEDAKARREWKQRSSIREELWLDSSGQFSDAPAGMVRVQEEQTVSFSPCGMWRRIPNQDSVVQMGNLPAFIVSQWRMDCPPRWSIARMMGVSDAGLLSDGNFAAMRRVDVALCFLIAIQWFLVGGFPLIRSKRWWGEPGAFITACTAVGSGIALIPVVEGLARWPALIAFYGWLWWFGLLLWMPVHAAWSSTVHRLRRLSN